MWTLKVRAYEYDAARGYRALSNESSAMLMVYLGQPPLLTSPHNGSEWDTDRPNNLLFQWTPRASSTVGGMGGIAYQFELWELGSSENENDVASGKQPILSEVVNSPLFLYDASKAPLVQGKRYAWRVKVIDANRSRKFENEGYSEVWTFRYGVSCSIPSGLQVSKIGSGVLHLAWNGLSGISSYQVRWQKSGEQVYSYQTTNFNFLDLNGVSDSNVDFEVRSLCKTGEYSDWSEVLSFVTPQGMTALSNKNPVNELSSTSTSSTPTDPLEQVVSSATVSDGDLAGFQSQYEQAPNVREQRCGGVVISQTSSCEIPQASSYGGAVPFSSLVNSTLYINGYEIVITKVVNDQEGEGLLYFPYLGKRIPVEWKGVSIREGEQPTYGCIVSGTVQAQGSNSNILGDDLKRQYLALYNNLNNPGSFTGTFGQAIEAMKTKAQELLDKIGKGEKPTKEDYKGYNSICKAIDKGIDAWKQSLEDQYGATTSIAAVQQLYRDLATTKSDLLSELSCDGTGYVPFAREEEVFYASVSLSKERFKLPTLENYLVSKCKLEQAESNASKLLSLIESEKELKKNSRVDIPQASVSLKLVGQTLTCSYTHDNVTSKHSYGFKQGVILSSSNGELIVNGVVYLPIKDGKTGAFLGFYQKNYIAKEGEQPENMTIKIGIANPIPQYKGAFLDPTLYTILVDEPQSLVAIDNDNLQRKAYEGEVLYLVRQSLSNRQVNYQWNTNIVLEGDQASLILPNNQVIYPKVVNNKTSYIYNEAPYSTVFKISTFNINKSVTTKLVNPEKQSSGLSRELEIVQKGNEFIGFFVNKLNITKFSDMKNFLSGEGFRILFNPKIGNRESENKEDKDSRLYINEITHKNSFEFGIKGEKEILIPETGFETDINLGCPLHIKLGLFLTPSANALAEIGIAQTQQIYSENVKPELLSEPSIVGEFKVDVGLKLGPKLEFDACDGAKAGLSGTVGASAILLQIKKPDSGDKEWITSPFLKDGAVLSGEFKWWLEVSKVIKFERSTIKSVKTSDLFK